MKSNVKRLIIIAVLLAVISTSLALIYAKYREKLNAEKLQKANEFYFSSDVLARDGETHNLYGWLPDEDYSFDIVLKNYEDELHITELSFSAALTANSGVDVLNAALNPIDTVSFTASKQSQTLTVLIPAGSLTPDLHGCAVVSVSAAVFSPYEKTLYADFILNPAPDMSETFLIDKGVNVELCFQAQTGVNYSVSWPVGYSPDNTSTLLSAASDSSENGGGTHSFSVSSTGFVYLVFFKIGDCTAPDNVFSVSNADLPAVLYSAAV